MLSVGPVPALADQSIVVLPPSINGGVHAK
jgi:hypothetical protein